MVSVVAKMLVYLEDATKFSKSQCMLHGFQGILEKAGKVAAARYMQVQAARFMCISCMLEIEAIEEEKSQNARRTESF
ncbi:hypothetical protein PIB30_094760 [Stylosanthes scabra]|uniref:Uncharacterized protein n=1 Tax=Stylosanthes scabra TaxID=79078 RepID=A0ABU6UXW3_9FABA|nr:hypothetical protein [Stylosanthes scabra]